MGVVSVDKCYRDVVVSGLAGVECVSTECLRRVCVAIEHDCMSLLYTVHVFARKGTMFCCSR